MVKKMRKIKQKGFEDTIKQELSIQNGVVEVNESSCDGCGNCVEICPQSAISMKTLSADDIPIFERTVESMD